MDYLSRLLPGTLSIALTFVVLGAAFTGIGLAVRRAFGLVAVAVDDCLVAFWIGFAAVILFLLIWNFALPVGSGALAVMLIAGALGLVWVRGALVALYAARQGKLFRWTIVALVIVGFWIANLATGGMINWDTALYHMQGVRWAHTYPVVPGLANLFGPLGFNNSSLLYDAMLDTGPWAGRAWHVANGLLVFVLAAQAIVSGARFIGRPEDRRASDLFGFLFLAAALSLAVGEEVRSFVTDVSATAVRLVVIALWYRSLTRERRDAESEAYDLICIVALSATAVAIKMNAIVFSATMVAAAVGVWLARREFGSGLLGRTARWSATVGLAFGMAWAARGLILSGYPAFPSRVLAAPVEWRVPAEHAEAEFDYVRHSTRSSTGNIPYISGRVTGLRAWVPRWARTLRDDPFSALIPTALALLSLPVLVVFWRRSAADARTKSRPGWWILLPTAVALVGWFATAPAPRYATAAFWTLPAFLAGQTLILVGARVAAASGGRFAFAAALVLGVSPIVVNPLLELRRARSIGKTATAIGSASVRLAPPGAWFGPPAGRPVFSRYRTRSGLGLNVPDERCWDGELPCTPNPAPNLRLRVPGQLDKGFVVDGEWQMLNWPEKWKEEFLPAWRESVRGRSTAPHD